ncbi:MAG: enoyl-CoA hydratase/isomerase family protein [Thermoplasmata archaeon]
MVDSMPKTDARSAAGSDVLQGLIVLEWKGPVVILTLNNPPLNVLTTALLDEMRERILELSRDRRVRAVVITGSGERAFSGGANVREMLDMTQVEALQHSAKGQELFSLLERAPFPVIAAVRGFCVGGGTEMVQACDFVLAGEDAFFGQPEINIGVVPGWGGSRRLTRTIGPRRARHWIMTGEKVGAAQALQDGFLDRVVAPGEVLVAAIELGTRLAGKPAEALAGTKYLVNYALDPDRGSGLKYERALWGQLFETPGQREGMRAFLEKRPAVFNAERTLSASSSPFPWDDTKDVSGPGKRVHRRSRKAHARRPGAHSRTGRASRRLRR